MKNNYIVREEQISACTRCKRIFWEKAKHIRREHVSTCPQCRRLLWLENAGRP
jgi:uncharacterized protein with PIN domain